MEFQGVRGRLVGEEGHGVRTIVRMVNHTRLDCLIGSASAMRWGLAQAVHHARHRSAFGRLLAEQPLMQNVLADLAIESEAATATAMRVARAYDEQDAPFRRFATAVMKYWVCKRAPQHALEALECLGGNGYVEESGLPRLLRDSPLNSIWEGSGNVAALDVLRATLKEPEGLPAFIAECELARGARRAARRSPGRAGRPGPGPGVRGAPAGRATWRWRSRPACSSGTPRRPWPTRSVPHGSRAAAGCSARSPPAWTPARSSSARSRSDRTHPPAGLRPGPWSIGTSYSARSTAPDSRTGPGIAAMTRRLILATCLLAALLAAAPSAEAAKRRVPRGFFGTIFDGPIKDAAAPLVTQEFGRMASSGVESVRTNFFWSRGAALSGRHRFLADRRRSCAKPRPTGSRCCPS